MDDYHLRPIEPKDQERVLGIISRNDEDDEDEARNFFKTYFENESNNNIAGGRHYIVDVGEDLVAIGGYVVNQSDNKFWIGFLFVDPYYQGQGIGTLLMKTIIEQTSKQGADSLFVTMDREDIPTQAYRFYEANGFWKMKSPPEKEAPIVYSKTL